MSSGHRHQSGFGINSQVLERFLKNENIQRELYRPRKIDKTFDIPYLGGYSKSGETIYFDRHLPEKLKVIRDQTTREIDPIPFLSMHESMEKTLLDQKGYNYQHAHKLATAYERRGVLQLLGPGWWESYQKSFNPYIKADSHEKLKKIPSDLDLEPYQDEHDTKLLSHLESVIGGKASQKEAAYSSTRGKSTRHCGPDKDWPHNFCEHFKKPHSCTKVSGKIATKGGCKLYEKADE